MSQDTLRRLRAGELTGCKRLDLSCELTDLPPEVFALADTLEVLNLTGNRLSQLPDLSRLRHLKVLFCSDNAFTTVPEHLGDCPQLSMVGFKSNQITQVPDTAIPPTLRWLILTANEIASLPESIGQCTALEKVALAGNRLRTLPESMAACQQLGLLRISANDVQTLPGWLLSLPKLAWLAYGGNPCEASASIPGEPTPMSWPLIPWSSVTLAQLLGEGASGHIHAGTWQRTPSTEPEAVAVKLYKGALTSDGLPDQELHACLTAGAHPHLIPVHGVLQGHPEDRQGLVMPQLDANWGALAGPPSLDSCTRDVYAPDAAWSIDIAWRLAQGIAAATAHLHTRGVLHGDLYAHNILWRSDGQALLGDFGAASLLPTGATQRATRDALEKMDTLAFGHLLEELLQGAVATESDDPRAQALRHWQARCTHAHACERPTMEEVRQALFNT
ncbi:MAG: leucine-rich repeat-containing protein kinase family protein [Aquabacterium sp.]|uniref:leucine-rich repeat-containing protein kinase family protein n=1 Tax=Aquabacterium sp. TaxID=1872578 RepID=UPI003BC14D54